MFGRKKEKNGTSFLIPGGLLVGLGIGFIYNNIPAGTLIGLGAGFILFAIIKLAKK